jgi:hypothetical protein
MDEETQLSGILIRTGGKLECFWEGKNFGSVIPEELIDAELSTSKTKKVKENN